MCARAHVFARVCAHMQLQALHLNSCSHGQSEEGLQGVEAMAEEADAQISHHLPLSFHLPFPTSNNKLFHSGISVAGRPQTHQVTAHSRCLIQCSEGKTHD